MIEIQKIRSGLIKFAASVGLLAHEELFRLIKEEEDIIDASLEFCREREEAAQVLEQYAQAEEEELKNIMLEVVQHTRALNTAQTEMFSNIKEQYINNLATIRDKLAELDEPKSKAEDAEKALEKAQKTFDSKKKKLDGLKAKGDEKSQAKVPSAQADFDQAQAELNAAKQAKEQADEELKRKSEEIKAFKKMKLKESFKNLTDLYKGYHGRALEILGELDTCVETITP